MGVWVMNETGESLTVKDVFVNGASGCPVYDGTIKEELPHKGRKFLRSNIFTEETINERRPLQVHIEVAGKELLILHHDVFEKNKAIIFVVGKDNNLTFNHVLKDTARATGFADRIWRMIPCCGPEADIEALILAAKPWKET